MSEAAAWREKATRLKKLVAASQALATVESVDELLPILLLMAQEVTAAQASSILLYDANREVLVFSLAMNETRGGVQETLKSKVELHVGEGIAGHVAKTREPLRVDDAQADSRVFRAADEATGFETRNLICVPIVHDEELLGVAQVLNAKQRDAFDDDDVELLECFAHLASVALVRRRLMESRLQALRLESQLEAAARIQRHFWPVLPESTPNIELAGSTVPAISVGGDLYDFIALPDGAWLICVGDVSGKGLPAAMVMAATWAKLRTLAASTDDVAELLGKLNAELWPVLGGEVFVTAVVARYQPATQDVSIATAGHLPPIVVSEGFAGPVEGLEGVPLGVIQKTQYSARRLRLCPGERVLLVSDGVTEARNGDGEFFEFERLLEICTGHQGAGLAAAVQRAVLRWRAGREANDDTTVAVFGRAAQEHAAGGVDD